MTTDVTSLLRETRLLRSAPAADLRVVAAASRARTFRRGQVVFSADDPGDTLIIVVSGRVKVVVRSADGSKLTLRIIQPGGVFGELSVADGGSRSADAETLEESELLIIPRAVIQDACSCVPSVAQAPTACLAATLRRLTEATSDLFFLDLPRRVARVLLSQPRGNDGVIRPGMSQEELARQARGTRHSVNAALRGFERRGWITTHGRAVTSRSRPRSPGSPPHRCPQADTADRRHRLADTDAKDSHRHRHQPLQARLLADEEYWPAWPQL
jgi:CRP-like cAMP-binding protein